MLRVAQSVTLKVAELASGRLHDNSVVYVHPSKMDALSLFDGDVVRLEGTSGRVTVGIVVAMADAGVIRKAQCTDKADAVDEVQMNWAMRHNLGVFLHGYVTICRLQLDPPQATRVHIRVVADTLHPGTSTSHI
jgi:anaerobic selenocysteine-containing dehydrogenase